MSKIVFARKKSPDPVQEKLRADKDAWNEHASKVISEVIALKRALNGRGDKEFGLPPSNIKDPLPQEISSFMRNVEEHFSSLTNAGESIISEQENYSHARKQHQEPTHVATNLNPRLEKYSSNILSRYYTYLKSVFTKDPYKDERISLLKTLSEIDGGLKDFESEVLSNDIGNIPNADKYLKRVILEAKNFDKLNNFFNKRQKADALEELKNEQGTELEFPVGQKDNENHDDITIIYEDCKKAEELDYSKYGQQINKAHVIMNMVFNYKQENDKEKEKLKFEIKEKYIDLIEFFSKLAKKKISSVAEFIETVNSGEGGVSDKIDLAISKRTMSIEDIIKDLSLVDRLDDAKYRNVISHAQDIIQFGTLLKNKLDKGIDLKNDKRSELTKAKEEFYKKYINFFKTLSQHAGNKINSMRQFLDFTNGNYSPIEENSETEEVHKSAQLGLSDLRRVPKDMGNYFLNKLKKRKLKLNPFSRLNEARLFVYKLSKDLRKQINNLMEQVENPENDLTLFQADIQNIKTNLTESYYSWEGFSANLVNAFRILLDYHDLWRAEEDKKESEINKKKKNEKN